MLSDYFFLCYFDILKLMSYYATPIENVTEKIKKIKICH